MLVVSNYIVQRSIPHNIVYKYGDNSIPAPSDIKIRHPNNILEKSAVQLRER